MTAPRHHRVARLLMSRLSDLLLLEANDPRLDGVTITEVEVDRELQMADVFVNALGEDARREEVIETLQRAAGFLRHRLGESLDLRKVPELRFTWDTAFENASHIEALLDSLDAPNDPSSESGQDGEPV